MNKFRNIVLAAVFGFSASVSHQAFAQSIISLDQLGDDISDKPKAAAAAPAASSLENCLLGGNGCSDGASKSSSAISLDDVVNIGIIDHEEAAAIKAKKAESGQTASAEPLPSIDMEILFDYNSANIRPDQYPKLLELARVLNGDKFADFRFMFLGHTDAKGSQDYNMALSARRAQAVADFIRGEENFSERRVLVSGAGSSRLKDVSDPFGEQNRRVQLVLIPAS
ncbi:OmpA family protein [Rhizobium sp. L1K21]|uniref:OmpA family protein n=1 Tax=Rhizobium sp. L1K21 TaxID=2954933 RepID=UPI0020929827|nr:OmpA family protein [Rhizobium sp. L1K21]MCO6184654.1 OmpA family protein [Rhizobium sp. L1K21]